MSGQEEGVVDPLMAIATPIQALEGEVTLGRATGFFYAKGNRLFVITNRHVVTQEEYEPDSLKIRVHADPKDLRKNVDINLPLHEGSRSLWREFDDKTIDIAAIELDSEEMKKYVFKAFSAENLPPGDLLIGLGEDVLVMGYPLSFHDDVFNLPIIRTAAVASQYPVPFRGRPFFLIDARLHRGTSGSPVILKPTNILRRKKSTDFISGFVTFLLGIHSHTFPVPISEEPLGLYAVWFAHLIENLTQ